MQVTNNEMPFEPINRLAQTNARAHTRIYQLIVDLNKKIKVDLQTLITLFLCIRVLFLYFFCIFTVHLRAVDMEYRRLVRWHLYCQKCTYRYACCNISSENCWGKRYLLNLTRHQFPFFFTKSKIQSLIWQADHSVKYDYSHHRKELTS